MTVNVVAGRSETSPLGSAVLSVTMLRAGDAYNVIPDTAMFAGTIRALSHDVMTTLQTRLEAMAAAVASGFGCERIALLPTLNGIEEDSSKGIREHFGCLCHARNFSMRYQRKMAVSACCQHGSFTTAPPTGAAQPLTGGWTFSRTTRRPSTTPSRRRLLRAWPASS